VKEDTGDQDNQHGLEGDDGKLPANEDVVMDPTRNNDTAMDFAIENVVREMAILACMIMVMRRWMAQRLKTKYAMWS